MSTILLHKIRKRYYTRSGVPTRLQRLLNGRKQIWRSLKTADKDASPRFHSEISDHGVAPVICDSSQLPPHMRLVPVSNTTK
jgi:uncharacterized protein DUF6538